MNKEVSDLNNVFSYMTDSEKTSGKKYVSTINCLKEIALQQMLLTKKQFNKTDGYIAWHGYQSFKPGEVSPAECHTIGVELARKMWGDRFQVIVTTHVDKDHLHNHFCLNSVSFLNGKKYNYSKTEQKRLRDTSDMICVEHELEVIKNPGKSPPRNIYFDEKSGKPTRYNIYREDIEEALADSFTFQHFFHYLRRKGYELDTSGKYWKMKLPHHQRFTRLRTLDERFTPDWIKDRILENTSPVMGARVTSSPYLPQKYKNAWQPNKKVTGIRALYIYWCYQLGIFPKGNKYKPTSALLREDIKKMDEYVEQIRHMAKNDIETWDDLIVHIDDLQRKIDFYVAERVKLQNKIRRTPDTEVHFLREKKKRISVMIAKLRKNYKLTIAIRDNSIQISEKMNTVNKEITNIINKDDRLKKNLIWR